MAQIRRLDREALTLEEHRALELTRPFTDPLIGATSERTRQHSAELSAFFTDDSVAKPGWRKPPKPTPRQRKKKSAA